MKKIFIFIIAFLPCIALAQTVVPTSDPFTIIGNIKNVGPPARAYLFYQDGSTKIIDSMMVDNGTFKFEGKVLYPQNALLIIDHKNEGLEKIMSSSPNGPKINSSPDALNFYVERGIMFVDATDSIARGTIKGSKINNENAELLTSLKPLEEPTKKLYAAMKAVTAEQKNDPGFRKVMADRSKVIQDQQKAILKDFIAKHPESYISIGLIHELGPHVDDPRELEVLFNGLSTGLQNSIPGIATNHAIQQAKVTGIGVIAPDFTQNDVNDKPVTLSSFRGKYVLIDFWASWCGPCREENPNLVKTYNKYKDKNFTVLGVSLDRPDGKNDWLKAIKNDGLTWTQVSDLNFWSNKVAVMYFITEVPSNFLLDPNGKIIARNLRGDDLDQKLQQVLEHQSTLK